MLICGPLRKQKQTYNLRKKSALMKCNLPCFTAAKEKIIICGRLRKQKQTLSCSLWGKFGEHQNKPQTHVITSPHQLFNILDDPVYEISAVRICSEDVMELVTTMAQEKCESSFKANVFTAAFTTSHARLKLVQCLGHPERTRAVL